MSTSKTKSKSGNGGTKSAAVDASEAQIELRNVTHAFDTAQGPLPVLDNLSFSVPKGGFTAVVGPSGCG